MTLDLRTIRQLPETAIAQGDDAIPIQAEGGPVQWIPLSRVIGRLGPVDLVVATIAGLDLAHAAGILAIVYADPDETKNGYWVKTGASGAGAWVQSEVFFGSPGKSAYEVAVDNGFVGTEAEWLESLNGVLAGDYLPAVVDETGLATIPAEVNSISLYGGSIGGFDLTVGTATHPAYYQFMTTDGATGGLIGWKSANNRIQMLNFGAVTGYEFAARPYVGNTQIMLATDISDAAYGAGWDGDLGAATKNAIYDKIYALEQLIVGAMRYQGVWNATTNTPPIPAAAAGNRGYYFKVSVAGTTSISGINDWALGDWIVSNGASWDKVDNTDSVTSVAGLNGVISAAALRAALAMGIADVAGLQAALDAKLTIAPVTNLTNIPGAAVTPNSAKEVEIYTAVGAPLTINAPSGAPGQTQALIIRLKDDGTARALTWNAIYRSFSGAALPTTTVLGKTIYVGFLYNTTDTKWDCIAVRTES